MQSDNNFAKNEFVMRISFTLVARCRTDYNSFVLPTCCYNTWLLVTPKINRDRY